MKSFVGNGLTMIEKSCKTCTENIDYMNKIRSPNKFNKRLLSAVM